MAITWNRLTIEPNSVGWREIINSNFTELEIATNTAGASIDDLNNRVTIIEGEYKTPTTDVTFSNATTGVVLTDRTDGIQYRLFIDGGVLQVEAI